MADYDCEGCPYQEMCTHAYNSSDCIYTPIENNPDFNPKEVLELLNKTLDIFKSNDMIDEEYQISRIIDDLEYYYSEELKKEYEELIK